MDIHFFFLSSLPEETLKIQFFSQLLAVFPPTHPAVFPVSHLVLSQQGALLSDMTDFLWVSCPCTSVLQILWKPIQVFAERSLRRQGTQRTCLSAGLHTTAAVMVGMRTCNDFPVTYRGLPRWVAETFNTSAF